MSEELLNDRLIWLPSPDCLPVRGGAAAWDPIHSEPGAAFLGYVLAASAVWVPIGNAGAFMLGGFMRLKHTWPTLAMLVLFSATIASAQTAGTARPDLGNLLTPGVTVWITDSSAS